MLSVKIINLDAAEPFGQTTKRILKILPRREWGLLSLVYRRGATRQELAAVLGISRASLRKRIKAATRRATNPLLAVLSRQWGRLEPAEQRLAYLRLVLGLSLREIARRRLVPGLVRGNGPPSASSLRRHLARIERRFAPPATRPDTQSVCESTESNRAPARTGP